MSNLISYKAQPRRDEHLEQIALGLASETKSWGDFLLHLHEYSFFNIHNMFF